MDAKRAPFQFSPPGRALFHYAIRREALEAEHGPPHYAPEGPRRLPAWGFELPDGLILELQVNDELGLCYVHGPLKELRRAMLELGVSEDRVSWRMDDDWTAFERALEAYHPADWGRWTLRLPSGERLECLSQTEAELRQARLQAAGQGPVAIEVTPIEAARERRRKILAARTAQRKLPGERDARQRWEVWQVGPGDAMSLLAMFPTDAEAEALRRDREAADAAEGTRFEVRLRAR